MVDLLDYCQLQDDLYIESTTLPQTAILENANFESIVPTKQSSNKKVPQYTFDNTCTTEVYSVYLQNITKRACKLLYNK